LPRSAASSRAFPRCLRGFLDHSSPPFSASFRPPFHRCPDRVGILVAGNARSAAPSRLFPDAPTGRVHRNSVRNPRLVRRGLADPRLTLRIRNSSVDNYTDRRLHPCDHQGSKANERDPGFAGAPVDGGRGKAKRETDVLCGGLCPIPDCILKGLAPATCRSRRPANPKWGRRGFHPYSLKTGGKTFLSH